MKIARRDLAVSGGWPDTAGSERWALVLDIQKGQLLVEHLRSAGGSAPPSRRTLTVAECLAGTDGAPGPALERIVKASFPEVS